MAILVESEIEMTADLLRGVVGAVPDGIVEERLAGPGPLRIKMGIDPTRPDLHLGHMVCLRRLAAFQRAGHTVVLVVGDATARVGDPSGRNKMRPVLEGAEVQANGTACVEKAGAVLDLTAAEVVHNSSWFDEMGFQDVVALAARTTVARVVERDDFRKRMDAGQPVGMHELLYPLMQGWDSVQVRADIEIGGTDQIFNLLMGRQLQELEGMDGQACLTWPLILGTDGRKMSKTYDNAISLEDGPSDIYGRVMSIPDDQMVDWFTLLTDEDIEPALALIASDPRQAKGRLAGLITSWAHGDDASNQAAAEFLRMFADGGRPDDMPEVNWSGGGILDLVVSAGFASSKSEARRLVQQGGVRVDDQVVEDIAAQVAGDAQHLQVGKRRHARLVRA